MIVADASCIVGALQGPGEARDLLASEHVVVPHLVDAEVANAFRGLVARGALSEGDARVRLGAWTRYAARRQSTAGLLPRIWGLRATLTAYDATYVALAEALGCPLVTCDARLARAPGPRCPIRVAGL
ncbi:MAG: type II toxin-antitoxin system VapC family toxin [Thermoleophilia bacterium]